MTSILGIDLSSFQLNGALLIDDQPPILRAERLGGAKDPLIDRVRAIPRAVEMLSWVPRGEGRAIPPPDWIVIESAYGHGAHALHLTTGAIIASCPAESQIALISSGDWRKAIGAKNTKADGHVRIGIHLHADHGIDIRNETWDEHELDAIGIALAWRRILAEQVAA